MKPLKIALSAKQQLLPISHWALIAMLMAAITVVSVGLAIDPLKVFAKTDQASIILVKKLDQTPNLIDKAAQKSSEQKFEQLKEAKAKKEAATSSASTAKIRRAAPASSVSPAINVAPGVPYQISIPSIGLSSYVTPVGLTGDGAVDVPGSGAGWWNGSSPIGGNGAAFFDGHTPGVFGQLNAVGPGSQIIVNAGGDRTVVYQVVATEIMQLDSINMSKALSVYGGGAHGLNIMTCAGEYLPSRDTYSQRLVVYAVQI